MVLRVLVSSLAGVSFVVSCAKGGLVNPQQNSLAGASDLAGTAKVCNDAGSNARTISMPVDHFGYSDKKFTYTYQVIPGAKLGPAIVYIPGGPGGTSVADQSADIFPIGFTKIFIDPRGVGCNYAPADLPDVAISEANHIMDMVTVIKSLEPAQKSNLLIYGVSYGTVAGTLLVHKLEDLGVTVKATILEGTLGINNNDKLMASFEGQAMKRIKDKLITEFPKTADLVEGRGNPFGLNQDLVDSFIFAGLYFDYKFVGTTLTRAIELNSRRAALSSEEARELNELLAKITKIGKEGASGLVEQDYGSVKFFTIVRCGNLGSLAEGVDFCTKRPRLKGYDSKDYQLKSPIYYFQSKIDPATTYESARYHFENQRAAVYKVFTVSENFGHGATHYRNQLRPCADKLFTAISQLKQDFSDILAQDGSCKVTAPPKLERPEKSPGPNNSGSQNQ